MVKNTIKINNNQAVNLLRKESNKATPKITSKAHIKTESASTIGFKKVSPNNTKYSSSLIEKPVGSFNFIKPEMINNIPTKYLLNFNIFLSG
jgi:hypothetical protein